MPGYERISNTFSNPQNGAIYRWELNHSEEAEAPRSYQMGDGAATNNIGMNPQQGPAYPLVLQWKGTILTQTQRNEFAFWFALCEYQTIYLTDYAGAAYEILITDMDITREGVAWNKRGQLPHIWKYTMTFRVLSVFAGDWLGTPL